MNRLDHDTLVNALFEGVYCVDTERRITMWNNAAESITGYSRAEVLGSSCSNNMLRHVDEEGNELCLGGCPLDDVLAGGEPCEKNIFLHHKNGYRVPVSVRVLPLRNPEGEITGVVELFTTADLPHLMKELDDVKQEACRDPLTGVGNRQYGQQTLEARLYEWKSMHARFGVIFLDIDHFKRFNDTYGHRTGDEVIVMVSKTISYTVRQSDAVCRWGGEEFVVILPGVSETALRRLAKRLKSLIGRSFLTVGEERLAVTVSLGATMVRPEDSASSILDRADSLMYASKAAGRNRVTFG